MENQWARERVRKLFTGAPHEPELTTTYKVGGVPLSVTGAHVALMVVPQAVRRSDEDSVDES